MKTGIAHLPLHSGKAPHWLFERMKKLAREIVRLMLYEFDSVVLMQRLSDPFWFQALGCVLGFDWHSSGLTTTVCGALKEGIKGMEKEIGFFICGGKGSVSRRTPEEIRSFGEYLRVATEPLVYASRMAAKVDSAAVQDGYQIYHHVMFFNRDGKWAVVQQGMNDATGYARRYHWLCTESIDFVCEPHQAVCCEVRGETLNLVAEESEANRTACRILATESPGTVIGEMKKLQTLELPRHHQVLLDEINSDNLYRILLKTYEMHPQNFEELLGIRGVGAKTLRALSLLAELVYGAPVSFRDPARFSYTHGGKDGYPYPVDREAYDRSINFLKELVNNARIGEYEKQRTFKRLKTFCRETAQ